MSSNLLRPLDAAKYLTISKSTFWRWVGEGKLPEGIHLSGRVTVWKKEDLDAFIELMAENISISSVVQTTTNICEQSNNDNDDNSEIAQLVLS